METEVNVVCIVHNDLLGRLNADAAVVEDFHYALVISV